MKTITLVVCLFLTISSLIAQDKNFAVELLVSPSLTTLRGNHIVNSFNANHSLSPGISIQYFMSNQLSISTGFVLEKKGSKYEIIHAVDNLLPAGPVEGQINSRYLTLPVSISYHTGKNIDIYFGGGTFFGFLLENEIINKSSVNGIEISGDMTDDFKRIDLGLVIACGVNIPIGKSFAIDLGIRDHLGLLNTSKEKASDGGSVKTNVLGLVAGLKYYL